MATFIALLRAVNVGGRKVEMARLRAACEKAGFADVRTYIASGNVVLSAPGSASAVATKLQASIETAFGIEVPVVVRTAKEWESYLQVPKAFAKMAEEKPNGLLVGLSTKPPSKDAAKALAPRATAGEVVELHGDALWIQFTSGVAGSKLTPAAIDKAMGSPTTARNWNTMRKLAEMAGIGR